MRRLLRAGFRVLIASVLAGCATRLRFDEASTVRDPAWECVFQRDSGWLGGDGAATVVVGDRVLWLFGDSGVGRVEGGKYAPGSTLVNNAAAIAPISMDAPPAPGDVMFAWNDRSPDGKPAALFTPARRGEWYWPTGGGAEVEGRGLVLFMSRLFRPREHDDGVWNFEGRGSDLLWIENPGPDPRAWRARVVPTPGAVGDDLRPAPRRETWGAAALIRRRTLFIYGVDATDGFNKKAILARVEASKACDTSAWEFFAGAGWSGRLEDAVPVAERIADEFSVSEVGGEFVLVFSEPMLGRGILVRTARSLEGPWGEAMRVYECPEPAADKRLMVYSAKAHPELSQAGELLVSYCVNSSDFWHMLSDATIYRPRFVRVRVDGR